MNPRQGLARLLVALSLACLLPACGFALRGSESASADGTIVHLRAAEPGSALVQTLSEALLAAQVMLSPSATDGGLQLQLGPTEFRLLHFLMTHPERVHSRTQLLDQVWGDHVFIEERTVDVHVKRLREALGAAGSMVETVRGAGYRFTKKDLA